MLHRYDLPFLFDRKVLDRGAIIIEAAPYSDLLITAPAGDLEMKGFVRQLPGKRFSKILLQATSGAAASDF